MGGGRLEAAAAAAAAAMPDFEAGQLGERLQELLGNLFLRDGGGEGDQAGAGIDVEGAEEWGEAGRGEDNGGGDGGGDGDDDDDDGAGGIAVIGEGRGG